MINKHAVPMQFHPRAFSALGAELVTNDYVAINELVKNSYDAYAYKVKVLFGTDISGVSYIEIIDDGIGMTQQVVEEAWAVIATPYKKKNPVITRNGRIRVVSGNKGLGRLASARLGNCLEILTKNNEDDCINVKIDWQALIESADISACIIDVEAGDEELLQRRVSQELDSDSCTGTILRITSLNATWDKEMISKLELALSRLISPFDDVSDFRIFVGSEGKDLVQIEAPDFIKTPTYHLTGIVNSQGEIRWNYNYNSKTNRNESGIISWEESYGGFNHLNFLSQMEDKMLPQYSSGSFSFELRAWDLDADSVGVISNQFNIGKRDIRNIISTYKGISIYRDNVLVLPKTDASRDWLGVDLRRVSNIGRRLSTNQIIGKISISSDKNPELKDTTDREKLVDTIEYRQFCYILETAIIQLEGLRNRDRVVPAKPGKIVDLITPIDPVGLENQVEKLVKSGSYEDVMDAVHEYSANAEKSIGELRVRMEYYAQTASLGSIAFVILHEIRTGMMPVTRLINWCKKNLSAINSKGVEYCNDAETANKRLYDVANSFAPIYRKDYLKVDASVKLADVINSSIKLISAKKEARDVSFTYSGCDDIYICMQSGEAQTIFINLLDNACYWLGKCDKEKIVSINSEFKNGKVIVNFSDNGPGFSSEDAERIFTPGTTGKPHGIGMGLVIVTELLSRRDCRIKTCVPGDLNGATFIFELPMGKELNR